MAPTQDRREADVSYHYAQVSCGFCGRFVTDVGEFISVRFAAAMQSGQRHTPGVDLLTEQPDLFMRVLRGHVVLEKQPRGLARALELIVPARPDPVLPCLYLQPHFCYHDLDADELQWFSQHERTTTEAKS
jgi:hypothetical protein